MHIRMGRRRKIQGAHVHLLRKVRRYGFMNLILVGSSGVCAQKHICVAHAIACGWMGANMFVGPSHVGACKSLAAFMALIIRMAVRIETILQMHACLACQCVTNIKNTCMHVIWNLFTCTMLT